MKNKFNLPPAEYVTLYFNTNTTPQRVYRKNVEKQHNIKFKTHQEFVNFVSRIYTVANVQ